MTRVSVIVTSFQGAPFLREALESVLKQTYRPFEVIVIDDGSTDGSLEILQTYSDIILIQQNRKGVGAARNLGLARATGDCVAFLDGDDVWVADKLQKQTDVLRALAEPAIVFCQQQYFWKDGDALPAWVPPELPLAPHSSFVPGAVLTHRSCFEKTGTFDESLLFGNDTDWVSRSRDAMIPSFIVPEVLLLKRLHETNGSSNAMGMASDMRKLLRKAVQRKHGLDYRRSDL